MPVALLVLELVPLIAPPVSLLITIKLLLNHAYPFATQISTRRQIQLEIVSAALRPA